MAVQHLAFNASTPWGSQLRAALTYLENGLTDLNDIFATMGYMLDGGVATQYITDKFGFPDIPTAQAAYNELNSLQSKLNTDADVTLVHAAMLQAFNKFR